MLTNRKIKKNSYTPQSLLIKHKIERFFFTRDDC